MVEQTVSEEELAREQAQDKARLKPKNFHVRWFTKKNDQDATDHIKTHDLLIDVSIKQVATADPRMLLREEFRDSIKNQFKLLSPARRQEISILEDVSCII